MSDLRGWYQKFSVARQDHMDQPGEKHHGCRYFVLDLTHDPHAVPALRAYAESCAVTRPVLSPDLYAEIKIMETATREREEET